LFPLWAERELFALALALAAAALLALFATLLFALPLTAAAALLLLTFALAFILVCHCSILFPLTPFRRDASQATEQVFGFRCSASPLRASDEPQVLDLCYILVLAFPVKPLTELPVSSCDEEGEAKSTPQRKPGSETRKHRVHE
jgi:hypothetical protein